VSERDSYKQHLQQGPSYVPSVYNTKLNGVDGYATSDLFLPHPTKKGYWKIFGRADDQIMHNSGEKASDCISVC
jgi:hypothetical protein